MGELLIQGGIALFIVVMVFFILYSIITGSPVDRENRRYVEKKKMGDWRVVKGIENRGLRHTTKKVEISRSNRNHILDSICDDADYSTTRSSRSHDSNDYGSGGYSGSSSSSGSSGGSGGGSSSCD